MTNISKITEADRPKIEADMEDAADDCDPMSAVIVIGLICDANDVDPFDILMQIEEMNPAYNSLTPVGILIKELIDSTQSNAERSLNNFMEYFAGEAALGKLDAEKKS